MSLLEFVDKGLCTFESTITRCIGEVADRPQFLRLLRLVCLLRCANGLRRFDALLPSSANQRI